MIKNPHRIRMGLWGWKIIPIPTPYPYTWGSPYPRQPWKFLWIFACHLPFLSFSSNPLILALSFPFWFPSHFTLCNRVVSLVISSSFLSFALMAVRRVISQQGLLACDTPTAATLACLHHSVPFRPCGWQAEGESESMAPAVDVLLTSYSAILSCSFDVPSWKYSHLSALLYSTRPRKEPVRCRQCRCNVVDIWQACHGGVTTHRS